MGEPDAEILEALYQGVFDAASFDYAMGLLAESFGCVSTALILVDAWAPAANVMSSTGAFREALGTYLSDFAGIDPAPPAFARMPLGSASTTDRILVEEHHRGIFANEFYRPIGLVETLGGNLFADKSRTSLIGLHRGRDRPAFDEDEIAHVERLMPHIRRVLQLRRAFAHLGATAAGLADTVDRLEAGVVLLDQAGKGIFANRAMREMARSGDGLALNRDGQPFPTNLEARRRLNGLTEAVRQGGAGGTLVVPRLRSARAYAMLVAPWGWPETDGPLKGAGRGGALVLVHDPASRPTDAAILKECLDLTEGAAKLVAALAGQDDLKSFAEREGITIHTARFHLRTALARTGARTQAELVRVAVRLLRDMGTSGKRPM